MSGDGSAPVPEGRLAPRLWADSEIWSDGEAWGDGLNGTDRGVACIPGQVAEVRSAGDRAAQDMEELRASTLVDEAWYRRTHPDTAGQDAVAHFHLQGWRDGYRPNP